MRLLPKPRQETLAPGRQSQAVAIPPPGADRGLGLHPLRRERLLPRSVSLALPARHPPPRPALQSPREPSELQRCGASAPRCQHGAPGCDGQPRLDTHCQTSHWLSRVGVKLVPEQVQPLRVFHVAAPGPRPPGSQTSEGPQAQPRGSQALGRLCITSPCWNRTQSSNRLFLWR